MKNRDSDKDLSKVGQEARRRIERDNEPTTSSCTISFEDGVSHTTSAPIRKRR